MKREKVFTAFSAKYLAQWAVLAALPLWVGCTALTTTPPMAKQPSGTVVQAAPIAPFSAAKLLGNEMPPGWSTYIVTPNKRLTRYAMVPDDAGTPVLQADVDSSASGLTQALNVTLRQGDRLAWRWKIGALPAKANLRTREGDDAPVRIALAFDGDISRLSQQDHWHRQMARLVSGRDLPYATLMYVWANGKIAPETVVDNPYTKRIRAIAVESGTAHAGAWRTYERDVVADYERAFGEKPRRLTGIAIMSDGDNTRSSYRAWYGDIQLERGPLLQATAAQ